MDKLKTAENLIYRLGGTNKAARLFEINPSSVTNWRDNGIPKPRMMYLRLAYPAWFDADGNPIPLPPSAISPRRAGRPRVPR
jgi:hypothetical protein